MKRSGKLLFLVLSVLTLLISQWIPYHHHHEGKVCVAVDRCIENHHENDHANHSESHEGSMCSICISQSPFLGSSTLHSYTDVPIQLFNHTLHPLCIGLYSDIDENNVKLPYEYISHYKPTYICGSNGLRAPPVFSFNA